jgi:hypothetical protein
MQLTVCVNCGKANQQLKAIATSNSRPLPSASPHNQQLKIIAKHIVMQPATQDHCHKQCKTNLHCKTNVRYATLRPACAMLQLNPTYKQQDQQHDVHYTLCERSCAGFMPRLTRSTLSTSQMVAPLR